MGLIIARVQGGIGNQLFCYAAARRLALANRSELVLDDVTGFARDRLYHRQYMLDHFRIPVRKATAAERLEPFERYRRHILRWYCSMKPFCERRYLTQEGIDFDERLLSIAVKGTLYLDGLWQSEKYFKDVEKTIREDLSIIPPSDDANRTLAEDIVKKNSVAVHVRWFDEPGKEGGHNVSSEYYEKALTYMERTLSQPDYFLFSDDPNAVKSKLQFPVDRTTLISHNRSDEHAYADMWLMTKCKHFIIANSTFSWWAAWLGGAAEKMVVTPSATIRGKTAWGFRGLIPSNWVRL